MTVQHPIQQIPYTIATYSAFVPLAGTLSTRKKFERHEYICGEYYARREVFVDYYRASSRLGNAVAPYMLFARSGDTVRDIIDFTEEWGPLQPNHEADLLFTTAFEDRDPPASPDVCFAFYIDNWRAARRHFVRALDLVSQDKVEDLRGLLPYNSPTLRAVKVGGIYPYVDKGTDIEVLERLWTADRRITKQEVRRIAGNIGIFAKERSGPKYRLVYESVSLMDAFWHMLFLDLAKRKHTIRICANARCGKPFTAARTDQKYCTSECTLKTNKLIHYYRRGASRRKQAREAKKHPPSGPR